MGGHPNIVKWTSQLHTKARRAFTACRVGRGDKRPLGYLFTTVMNLPTKNKTIIGKIMNCVGNRPMSSNDMSQSLLNIIDSITFEVNVC